MEKKKKEKGDWKDFKLNKEVIFLAYPPFFSAVCNISYIDSCSLYGKCRSNNSPTSKHQTTKGYRGSGAKALRILKLDSIGRRVVSFTL
jgi:hypothetical protein